jgi:hypothetical protein
MKTEKTKLTCNELAHATCSSQNIPHSAERQSDGVDEKVDNSFEQAGCGIERGVKDGEYHLEYRSDEVFDGSDDRRHY